MIQLPPDLFFGTGDRDVRDRAQEVEGRQLARCSSTPPRSSFVAATRTSSPQRTSRRSSTPSSPEATPTTSPASRINDRGDPRQRLQFAVSSSVEERDDRVAVDIVELNAEIAGIVARQRELRTAIDEIVADLEENQS